MSELNFASTNQSYGDRIFYSFINNDETYSHTQSHMDEMHFPRFQNQPMNNIQESDSQSIANFNYCDNIVPYNGSQTQNSTQQTQFYSNINPPQQNTDSFNQYEHTQSNLQSTTNIRSDNNYYPNNQMNFAHDANIRTNTLDYGFNTTTCTTYHDGNQNLQQFNSIPCQFQQSFASQQSSLSYPPQSLQDCSCRHRKGCILENKQILHQEHQQLPLRRHESIHSVLSLQDNTISYSNKSSALVNMTYAQSVDNQRISFDAQQNVSRHFSNYADIDRIQQNDYVSNLNLGQGRIALPVKIPTSPRGRITEQEKRNINNERSRIYQQNKNIRQKQAKHDEKEKIKELNEKILELQKEIDMEQEQLDFWETKLNEVITS
uniref:BZIP domain-containing protein n=1 Tax=Rhabditophanes sp. KR3021 TaxID=114890 RepID=A0AC35U628_9BILA